MYQRWQKYSKCRLDDISWGPVLNSRNFAISPSILNLYIESCWTGEEQSGKTHCSECYQGSAISIVCGSRMPCLVGSHHSKRGPASWSIAPNRWLCDLYGCANNRLLSTYWCLFPLLFFTLCLYSLLFLCSSSQSSYVRCVLHFWRFLFIIWIQPASKKKRLDDITLMLAATLTFTIDFWFPSKIISKYIIIKVHP